MPEIICVGLLLILHLLTFNWIPLTTITPLMAWIIYSYRSGPRGDSRVFDAATICDQSIMNKHVRRNLFKTVFYTIHFIAFMYMALLELNTV